MQVLRILASLATVLVVSAVHVDATVREETKSLDQLYKEAVAEGGKLVVYHGGDLAATPTDGTVVAFQTAFPKMNLTMVIDYSKYHDVRVDNQLARDELVPDVVALQTLQDYPRWKKEGKLLKYKPAGFSKIYQGYVDPEGAWVSHSTYTFSYFYDTAQLNASGLPIPKSVEDLAKPIYANQIASTYPHDDDAALFVYSQYIEKYGWKWLEGLAKNNVQFARGSNTPGDAVGAKQKAIGVAGYGPWYVPTNVDIVGKNADSPYLSWGQRMAILKKAKHPAAAKLFLNWVISKEVQTNLYGGINSRTDVNVTTGPRAWEIPQASVAKFPAFMEDRANVERLKATMALYFGEVQGKPSPGELGLFPGL